MKYLAILFCLFPTTYCLAQFQKNDISFAATTEYINFQQFSPTYAFGITGEYMLGNHLGVEFDRSLQLDIACEDVFGSGGGGGFGDQRGDVVQVHGSCHATQTILAGSICGIRKIPAARAPRARRLWN